MITDILEALKEKNTNFRRLPNPSPQNQVRKPHALRVAPQKKT